MTYITIQEGRIAAIGDSKLLLDSIGSNSRKSFIEYTLFSKGGAVPIHATLNVGEEVELMPKVTLTFNKLIRRQSSYAELGFKAPTDISIMNL